MIQEFKEKTLALRKAKDTQAVFMQGVLAKANDFAKAETTNGTAPVTDDGHMARAINSFMKGIEETIKIFEERGQTDSDVRYGAAVAQRDLLKSFFPKEATADEVRDFVTKFVADSGEPDGKKLMGAIMKALNDKFGNALNKREASGIVQSVINS